jgi:hypothetical protein
MTLREKFYTYTDNEYSEKLTNAENCEKIADDFAIGFAEWLLKFDNLKNEKEYVIKQLLEIYKKENEL